MGAPPLSFVDAEPLGADNEPSFPPGGLRDHFADPPPPTEERVTDPGFATGDPPPLLSMPGSSLRSMLATPVEVALDDDPPPPPPLMMGGSPLLARAAGANMGDNNLLARARGGAASSPWEAQPPELWREGRPSGPVSIDEDMRMGGRISTDGTGESRRDRPSLASEGRMGRASLHDINKQAKEAEGKRRLALLVLLMALSLVLLITVHPGLLKGEAPRMELPELSIGALPWFKPAPAPAFTPAEDLTLPSPEPIAEPTEPAEEPEAGAPAPAPPATAPSQEPPTPEQQPSTPPSGQATAPAEPVGPRKLTPEMEDEIRSRDESIGVLVVRSQPQAVIYVNGRYIGLTPITREELKPGPYVVSAIVSGRGSQRQEVRIEATQSKELSFDFR